MIDYGLLVSMIVGFGVPTLLMNWWPLPNNTAQASFIDLTIAPAFAALVVGRLTALALDDPGSIGSISDMIIVRSGVEFWPGVAAAVAIFVWTARKADRSPLLLLAGLMPLAMVGYAAYEAGCVFRDGCYGPVSAFGLRPPGLTTTMLPIGLLMTAGVILGAILIRRILSWNFHPATVVLSGVAVIAAVRSIGSIWLPHVGEGLTRQHQTSIYIVALSAFALIGTNVKQRRLATNDQAEA